MTIHDINANEFNPYYKAYIDKAEGLTLLDGLNSSGEDVHKLLEGISEEKATHRYAEGKWSIKELVQHIIDVERIFAYRALRISRGDVTALAGFDQDDYIAAAHADERSFNDLIEEYKAVRSSTAALFKSFSSQQLKHIGTASGSKVSVRALGFIIIGHEIHHCNILQERYL